MKSTHYPVKPYHWFFRYIPIISNSGFNTLMTKTIYLSKDCYRDYLQKKPSHHTIAVIKHQEIHAKDASFVKGIKFLISKGFRQEEERKAYLAMFSYLKAHGQTWDLPSVAREFTGIRYLWMTNYSDGLKLITRIWEEA